jgi:GTPase SAR1 family protein
VCVCVCVLSGLCCVRVRFSPNLLCVRYSLTHSDTSPCRHQYDPTVEESYLTTIDIDGRALQVEILDTAGQKEYSPLRETFMHTGDGFLLIYSITDDQTLEELRDIKEQISRVHPNQRVSEGVSGCD